MIELIVSDAHAWCGLRAVTGLGPGERANLSETLPGDQLSLIVPTRYSSWSTSSSARPV